MCACARSCMHTCVYACVNVGNGVLKSQWPGCTKDVSFSQAFGVTSIPLAFSHKLLCVYNDYWSTIDTLEGLCAYASGFSPFYHISDWMFPVFLFTSNFCFFFMPNFQSLCKVFYTVLSAPLSCLNPTPVPPKL